MRAPVASGPSAPWSKQRAPQQELSGVVSPLAVITGVHKKGHWNSSQISGVQALLGKPPLLWDEVPAWDRPNLCDLWAQRDPAALETGGCLYAD